MPDGGLLRDGETGLYVATAALLVEVISPDDESYTALDHYSQHGVTELIYINPSSTTSSCTGSAQAATARSSSLPSSTSASSKS